MATRPTRRDLLLAAAFSALALLFFLAAPAAPQDSARGPDVLGAVLTLGMTLPLALHRAAPVPVLLLTLTGLTGAVQQGHWLGLAQYGVFAALASAAYHGSRRTAVRLALLTAVVVGTATWAGEDDRPRAIASVGAVVVLVVAAAAVGDALRVQRTATRRSAAAESSEAVSRDRVRIAREVHDIVGHALAGITLQARAGRRRVRRDPDAAETALDTIDHLATRALEETRAAVGVVRGADAAAALRPQPRLADLDELVADIADGDVSVQLHRGPGLDALPATVQASAYRIVQESLSNVVRHAGAVSAVVTLDRAGDTLVVDVTDDGRGPGDGDGGAGAAGGGHGVRGMRERALQGGGTFEAGPVDGGGWRVRAELPVGAVVP